MFVHATKSQKHRYVVDVNMFMFTLSTECTYDMPADMTDILTDA